MDLVWRTLLGLLLFTSACADPDSKQFRHYDSGDTLSPEIVIHNQNGEKLPLVDLVSDNKLTVLYLFGGGAMGIENKTGGLWCTDSYEDSHILRTLYAKYKDQDIGFIPIAFPAVFHTHYMNHPENVFIDAADDSDSFKQAVTDFVDSTWAAYESGIIPVEPFFDYRFRMLRDRTEAYGPKDSYWAGAFRKPDETQMYGVPSYWLIDQGGKILAAPFRGNIYHGLPETYSIAYTLKDVDDKIQAILHSM